MATFYLLDHSLKDAGGHHFDYAVHVLNAAEQAGYRVVVGAHRGFQRGHSLPGRWKVYPVFRHPMYCRYAACFGWQGDAIGPQGQLLRSHASVAGRSLPRWRWPEWWQTPDRARRLRSFAEGCRVVFAREPLMAGDQVFWPCFSDFDLLGLSSYLRGDPDTLVADWHLLFHFNILEGREPDYAWQSQRLLLLRRQFEAALSDLPEHRLHFYATTEQLTRQYNLLDVATFTPLPYPINDAFHPPRGQRRAVESSSPPQLNTDDVLPATSDRRPLRVTLAGAVRPEKGQRSFTELAARLWDNGLATGKLQLVVQCKSARWSRAPRRIIHLPQLASRPRLFRSVGERTDDPVVHVRHPLASSDYQALIHHTDIGLLLYDSQRYYARHAGVLGEYLSAGIPVIVPAGCWLAEQIAEAIQEHLDELHGQATSRHSAGSQATWRIPEDAGDVLVSFDCPAAHRPGTFVRIVQEQHDEAHQVVQTGEAIVSVRTNGRPTRVLFHLHPACRSLRLRCEDAYGKQRLSLTELRAQTLTGERNEGGAFPSGQVGLIAASPAQVPDLLGEMLHHYAHYRSTAERFASAWHAAHQPRRTVQTLLAKAAPRTAAVATPRAA